MGGDQNYGRAIETINSMLALEGNVQQHRQLRIRKASMLTKVGQLDEARRLVGALRNENVAYEPRLSAWIIFTEGLISHFSSLDVLAARDKFRRSYAIAVALADNELRAISAAWLSDSDYRLTNYESAFERIREAFQYSQSDSYEARSRASLVIASISNLAGDFGSSVHWYSRARSYAVSMGDIGTQSVMLFNSVSTRATSAIIDDCFGMDCKTRVQGLLAELRSVRNLDSGLGIMTLRTMIPTLEAELQAVLGLWESAASIFNSVLHAMYEDGQSVRAARYYAQLAWCHANLGNQNDAMTAVENAVKDIENCSDVDDTVILYGRLRSTYGILGNEDQRRLFQQYADHSYSAFREFQESLRQSVHDSVKNIHT